MASADPSSDVPFSDRRVCVSVVSHGQGELVDRLLADLARLPPGTVSRIIVTINLPSDPWTGPSGDAASSIVVIRNAAPLGFGANHNQAFAHCTEPVFAVVNPDIRLAANPFPDLLDRLGEDADCAVVAPLQVDAAGQRESFARSVPTPFNVALRRLLPAARKPKIAARRIEWLAGAFMLWRAQAFRRLGGFDDRYRMYCEDVDICLRLQLGGQRFAVVESAQVVHAAQRASRRSPRFLLIHMRSLARLWLSPVFWRFVLRRSRALPA
jgi:N-acetylglucosaminyl-diphospho-decaprenol L-rhamnosyltransferase